LEGCAIKNERDSFFNPSDLEFGDTNFEIFGSKSGQAMPKALKCTKVCLGGKILVTVSEEVNNLL
jgi:hypothetical protein